jgi:hypothetical protein
MRKIKIRGHKKRQKKIQSWIENESNLNLNLLDKYKYWHSDIYVHPWCDISIINSEFPEPTGKTRNDLILGLEKIYNNWRIELEKLNKPYYLKIWLYEPRISKSQVVCAIEEKIEYYSNIFYKIDQKRNNSDFCNRISSITKWELYEDTQTFSEEDLLVPEELYRNEEDYKFSIKLLKKLKRGNYRTEKTENNDTLYFLPKGKVWVSGN